MRGHTNLTRGTFAIACFLFLYIGGGGLIKVVNSTCLPPKGCTALAYFEVAHNETLSSVADLFNVTTASIEWYSGLPSSTSVTTNLTNGKVLLVPFDCQCLDGKLGHVFQYSVVQGDTGNAIAQVNYHFLTSVEMMAVVNPGRDIGVLYPGNILNIPVNCSCGNPDVSVAYGLFATYVARGGDNLYSLSSDFNVSSDILQKYNMKNLKTLTPYLDIVFIPMKDGNGTYPPFDTSSLGSSSVSTGTIAGATIGGLLALVLILLLVLLYVRKIHRKGSKLGRKEDYLMNSINASGSRDLFTSEGSMPSSYSLGSISPSMANLAIDRSIMFTYEELAQATDNFNVSKEVGRGGYGAVYYGEINGQRLAIKMMNIQASHEFYAELKVLTCVHHTNLVRLIGYCAENDSLFVVYEYVENGTLSEHLKASKSKDRAPLSWPVRVQIALDSARGLEYIHEHTTPTYIHRDIKSSNILLDKNFRAKVADFGLTKLTESGAGGTSVTLQSKLVGTFGYMAPEYARYGDISVKADVYSFGVVLYEIISAKDAIVHTTDSTTSSQGLVSLFESVLNNPNGIENIKGLIDPALGDDYPLEAIWKMAELARACTKEQPKDRPNMRSAVVALMTLSSTSISVSWVGNPFSQDQTVDSLISGR